MLVCSELIYVDMETGDAVSVHRVWALGEGLKSELTTCYTECDPAYSFCLNSFHRTPDQGSNMWKGIM